MDAVWDEGDYRAFFAARNRFAPYEFQVGVARNLAERRNVLLRAPTGAGKTLTVLTPFLYGGWSPKPYKLIYAVPLRTLAQSIYRTAHDLARRAGLNADEDVRMQTGEQPDDPFFALGRITIATYDQVLSGLLSGPYGLSPRLHNINSAAVCGAVVVFDEFHLMEAHRAFLTGAAGLHLFRDLTQSVWMTATATSPLNDVLEQALGCVDCSPAAAEATKLPVVGEVRRSLWFKAGALSAQSVLDACTGRTIVICNTVARAQAIYRELRAALLDDVPALLLHSRFFKPDRAAKEAQLEELFGKGRTEQALLVATQVIEAGIDISCDDLHTELCPMNALVQRAGRCARYPGEAGTVHVYDLSTSDSEDRWWLPYGDTSQPDPALLDTRGLVEGLGEAPARLDPGQVTRWVQRVHAAADAQALRTGWWPRQRELLSIVEKNSILRTPVGVTHLIREESLDDVRVIVASGNNLPDRSGEREAVTVGRWQLAPVVDDRPRTNDAPMAWLWEFGDDAHWEPLTDRDALRAAAIVCLAPQVARYTREIGLEVGLPGVEVSPPRQEPRRPGYGTLVREGWAAHSRAVAAEAVRRAQDEGVPGWLADGFARRYEISRDELLQAIRICGQLHDLGKLQHGWQDWANAWQLAKDPAYQQVEALAHTDADPADRTERGIARRIGLSRPPHAAASAYLSLALLPHLVAEFPTGRRPYVTSACLAAVLAHHGAWLPSDKPDLGLQSLWASWLDEVDRLWGANIRAGVAAAVGDLYRATDRRGTLKAHALDVTTSADRLATWWPLVAYLMRTLRLADQRATADAGEAVNAEG